jgi:hypothetical protein
MSLYRGFHLQISDKGFKVMNRDNSDSRDDMARKMKLISEEENR